MVFLHHGSTYAASNCHQLQLRTCTGCSCRTSLQCVFSCVTSIWLIPKLKSYTSCIWNVFWSLVLKQSLIWFWVVLIPSSNPAIFPGKCFLSVDPAPWQKLPLSVLVSHWIVFWQGAMYHVGWLQSSCARKWNFSTFVRPQKKKKDHSQTKWFYKSIEVTLFSVFQDGQRCKKKQKIWQIYIYVVFFPRLC